MINGKKCLAVIAARGGSKGLPGKNIADLGGKPLICWTIDAAHQSKYIDRVILSSDDDTIIDIARSNNCEVPFIRPEHLAEDESPIVDVLLHALDTIEETFDYLILLQATSPLRTVADIDGCIECCVKNDQSAVSIVQTQKPPEWFCTLNPSGQLQPILPGKGLRTRRQDLSSAYLPNGAVYVVNINWFREAKTFYTEQTIGYIMPKERSVDIDEALDLENARWILSNMSPKN